MPNITLIWLLAGVILCSVEFVLPTAFVALTMGVSAIAVSIFSLVIPNLTLQVVLWLIGSILAMLLSRKFLTSPKGSNLLKDSQEAETLTEIPPGESGRVLYEGNSWRAIAGDENIEISPKQKVYIIGRKGNTLIVLPTKFGD
jgi:membrane protein implicated in regulation of membrane protease activity